MRPCKGVIGSLEFCDRHAYHRLALPFSRYSFCLLQVWLRAAVATGYPIHLPPHIVMQWRLFIPAWRRFRPALTVLGKKRCGA